MKNSANIIYCILCVVFIVGMQYFSKIGQPVYSNMCQHATIIVCGLIFIPDARRRCVEEKSKFNLFYLGLLCLVEIIFIFMLLRTATAVF